MGYRCAKNSDALSLQGRGPAGTHMTFTPGSSLTYSSSEDSPEQAPSNGKNNDLSPSSKRGHLHPDMSSGSQLHSVLLPLLDQEARENATGVGVPHAQRAQSTYQEG